MTAVDADEIPGEDVAIPIDNIVAVETREFSIGKTALLAGGIYGTMRFVFIAIVPALILASATP